MNPNSGRERARRDIAADINAKILADLEKGVMPWRKPWNAARAGGQPGLPLRVTGEPYRGINVVLLWSAACDLGYRARAWMSFNQALKLGANVRKGENGQVVVYYGSTTRTRTQESGDQVEDFVRFLKSYVVFNAEQVDGLPEQFHAPPTSTDRRPLAHHEAWFAKLDIARFRTEDIACYVPKCDAIGMPALAAFDSPEHYAQTLDHECVHATKAAHRLDRDFSKRYPEHHYHVEEICAELGAAYLGAHLGLPPGHLHDHSAYIDHWIKLLKHDRRAFIDAAAKAQAAVDWLLKKSPPP